MSFDFRLDPDALELDRLPFFEEATAANSQYHSSQRSIEEAQDEVRQSMARLGGAVTRFIPVIFEHPERLGFLIEYVFAGGAFGRLPVAALPIRRRTAKRDERARVQALLIAADMLNAAANGQQHVPTSNPLFLHLLVDGEHTIAQMLVKRQQLPEAFLLPSGDVE